MHLRRFVAVLALSSGLLAPLALARPDEKGAPTKEEVLAALGESPVSALLDMLGEDVKRYNDHIETLANPFFEGRAPGTRGNRIAADYIEFWYRTFKLEPAFATIIKSADGTEVATPNASFRQPFTQGSELKVASDAVSIRTPDGRTTQLLAGTDYNVLAASGTGDVSGNVVFVGYSIPAGRGENDYASYPEGTDLTGKIALLLRFEPMDEAGHSKWVDQGWSFSASLDPKIAAAVERHAAAVILVNPPGADDERTGRLESVKSMSGRAVDVPVIQLSIDAADRLVRAADSQGRSLMDLRKLADQAGTVIDLPNAKATVAVQIERIPNETDNVGTIISGRGPLADEYVVIGAHYDHVGYGYFGADRSNAGKIHPGADDNGSGTSGVLLLAEQLSKDYAQLPADANMRSILILNFSAEESGLIGSRHFVQNPSIPLDKIQLMINLDMIGRVKNNHVSLEGIGSAVGLEEFARPITEKSGLEVQLVGRAAPNSDHASFSRANVPVLFFFTGTHPQYHKPEDVASLINHVGAIKIVTMTRELALEAARRTERFKFSEPTEAEQDAPRPMAMKVRFGIAPGDYSGQTKGVLVGDVTPGTSAAEGGILKDDLITKWNGKELAGVEEWMPLLAQHNPGDVVDVTVKRGDQELVLKVTLKARTSGG